MCTFHHESFLVDIMDSAMISFLTSQEIPDWITMLLLQCSGRLLLVSTFQLDTQPPPFWVSGLVATWLQLGFDLPGSLVCLAALRLLMQR